MTEAPNTQETRPEGLDPLAALEEIRRLCRSMDRGVGYRVPGDHSTWGEYHEGKSDFAGLVEEVLDRVDAPAQLPTQVSDTFNHAAEDVLGVAGREDDRLVDAVNLVVNAGLHYLEHPGDELDDAIEVHYADTDPDADRGVAQTVRGWLSD